MFASCEPYRVNGGGLNCVVAGFGCVVFPQEFDVRLSLSMVSALRGGVRRCLAEWVVWVWWRGALGLVR